MISFLEGVWILTVKSGLAQFHPFHPERKHSINMCFELNQFRLNLVADSSCVSSAGTLTYSTKADS